MILNAIPPSPHLPIPPMSPSKDGWLTQINVPIVATQKTSSTAFHDSQSRPSSQFTAIPNNNVLQHKLASSNPTTTTKKHLGTHIYHKTHKYTHQKPSNHVCITFLQKYHSNILQLPQKIKMKTTRKKWTKTNRLLILVIQKTTTWAKPPNKKISMYVYFNYIFLLRFFLGQSTVHTWKRPCPMGLANPGGMEANAQQSKKGDPTTDPLYWSPLSARKSSKGHKEEGQQQRERWWVGKSSNTMPRQIRRDTVRV